MSNFGELAEPSALICMMATGEIPYHVGAHAPIPVKLDQIESGSAKMQIHNDKWEVSYGNNPHRHEVGLEECWRFAGVVWPQYMECLRNKRNAHLRNQLNTTFKTFMRENLGGENWRANSYNKADIKIRTQNAPFLDPQGASIKSISAGFATTMNASDCTQILFKGLHSLPTQDACNQELRRLQPLKIGRMVQGAMQHTDTMCSEYLGPAITFQESLQRIDTQFPDFFAACVLESYRKTVGRKVVNVVKHLAPTRDIDEGRALEWMYRLLMGTLGHLRPSQAYTGHNEVESGLLLFDTTAQGMGVVGIHPSASGILHDLILNAASFDTPSTKRQAPNLSIDQLLQFRLTAQIRLKLSRIMLPEGAMVYNQFNI